MIPATDVNYLAVLIATIASMVVGMLWYSPLLFGNIWMNLMKINPKDMGKDKGIGKNYFAAFISTLIMSFILANFIDYAGAITVLDALVIGFMIWIGFIATVLLGGILWEGKPVKLFLINMAHYLAAILVMSIILTLWI